MFIKKSGLSARVALICVLLSSGSLLGCASTVITQVDQSDRDTAGAFDGVWNAKVVSTTTNQPLPGGCLLYTSPSPRDATLSRMPSSA